MIRRRPATTIAATVAAVVVLAALAAGCGGGSSGRATPATGSGTTTAPATTAPATTSASATPGKLVIPHSVVRFTPILAPPAAPAGTYPGPATPTSLDGVLFADKVITQLGEITGNWNGNAYEQLPAATVAAVKDTLARQGFVVLPTDIRQLAWAYASESYWPFPVFVTTDAATNLFHLAFDKVLRTTEQARLLPKLEELLAGYVAAADAQAEELAGGPLADQASRVAQLVQVAAAEAGLTVALGPLATREKALVDAHSATAASPISGTRTDYSLYTPRGHYTRTPALKRYFTAMSVLGQAAFCIPGTRRCDGLEPLQVGILAARALVRDPKLVALWQAIYEPTAFLVGTADDYTPLDVLAAAGGTGSLDDASPLAEPDRVKQIAGGLVTARPVQIDPEKASVRIMGTRFVVDSFVLDQLLWPNVGTDGKKRESGSSLDLAAAFGSEVARASLESAGLMDYEHYDTQLAALAHALAARTGAEWAGTVYDVWLHALSPLWAPHDETYPDFMRTPAWGAKALQSGLGSYAELKHDTLLYTKQGVAEGGGDEPPGPRTNWVEPEPLVFGRLAQAATMLRSGLLDRGLLTAHDRDLLRDEIRLFSLFARIARDELRGRPIAKADNEQLTFIGSWLDGLFHQAADQSGASESFDEDGAIVADIASGPLGALAIGTGRVGRLLVIVPDTRGRSQLAVGAVYSFYEFSSPPGERLTDEEWRARLDKGTAPAPPDWTQVLGPSAG